jgi:hypothetical protein
VGGGGCFTRIGVRGEEMFLGQCWVFRFGGGRFGNKGMERMTWGLLSRWEVERREFEVDGFGLNFAMRSFEASEEDGRDRCLLSRVQFS